MEERSRIRFNPVTKEIEVEGSEEFVRTYFDKLHQLLAQSSAGGELQRRGLIQREGTVRFVTGHPYNGCQEGSHGRESGRRKYQGRSRDGKVLLT